MAVLSAHSWTRQRDEPVLWYRRFEKFRLMEPVRSISAVFDEEHPTENHGKPRPKVPGDWYKKAKEWNWENRAAAWDAYQDGQIEAHILTQEKKILRSHYALKHRRVEELSRIATKLIGYLEDEKNIWLPDVKAVGTGEFAERVDLVRFNAPLFAEIRAHFDDIAKEKGERVKKNAMAISFPPDVYGGVGPDDDGSEL